MVLELKDPAYSYSLTTEASYLKEAPYNEIQQLKHPCSGVKGLCLQYSVITEGAYLKEAPYNKIIQQLKHPI